MADGSQAHPGNVMILKAQEQSSGEKKRNEDEIKDNYHLFMLQIPFTGGVQLKNGGWEWGGERGS